MQLSLELDERAGTELAAENFADGKGITNANLREDFLSRHLDDAELEARNNPDALPEDIAALDDIANDRGAAAGDPWDPQNGMSANQSQAMKAPDPFVNPKMFNDSEKSTYRPDNPEDAVKQNLRESVADMKRGGEGRSYNPLFTESALKRMSRGNKNIRQYITS